MFFKVFFETLLLFIRRLVSKIRMPQIRLFRGNKRGRTEAQDETPSPESELKKGCSVEIEDTSDFEKLPILLYQISQKGNKVKEIYEVMQTLGAGSFGLVLKVRDVTHDRTRALKMSVDEYGKEETMKEAQVLTKFKEMNACDEYHIVQIFDYFLWEGRFCIATELLSMNLGEYLSNYPQGLVEEQTIRILYQLLECIEFLNKQKIIHCDLKPQNIMVKDTSSLQIKVIDFGSSETLETVRQILYFQTRFYRAPEVFLGVFPLSAAVDIWSVGTVAAELHTGNAIFQGNNSIVQVNQIVETLGMPPENMLTCGVYSNKYFYKTGHEYPLYHPLPTIEGKWENPGSKPLIQRIKKSGMQLEKEKSPSVTAQDLIIDLICNMLEYDPLKRISASSAKVHKVFCSDYK